MGHTGLKIKSIILLSCVTCFVVIGACSRKPANTILGGVEDNPIMPNLSGKSYGYTLAEKVSRAKSIVVGQATEMAGSHLQGIEIENQRLLWGRSLSTNATIMVVQPVLVWQHKRDALWIFFIGNGPVSIDGTDFYTLVGGGRDRDGMDLATPETLEAVSNLVREYQHIKK